MDQPLHLMPARTPLLMSVPQASAYLGRSAGWVRERVQSGEIPARRIGRRFYLSRPDLDEWLRGESPVDVAPVLGVPSPKGRRG